MINLWYISLPLNSWFRGVEVYKLEHWGEHIFCLSICIWCDYYLFVNLLFICIDRLIDMTILTTSNIFVTYDCYIIYVVVSQQPSLYQYKEKPWIHQLPSFPHLTWTHSKTINLVTSVTKLHCSYSETHSVKWWVRSSIWLVAAFYDARVLIVYSRAQVGSLSTSTQTGKEGHSSCSLL